MSDGATGGYEFGGSPITGGASFSGQHTTMDRVVEALAVVLIFVLMCYLANESRTDSTNQWATWLAVAAGLLVGAYLVKEVALPMFDKHQLNKAIAANYPQ
jgi:hypothetical protein